MTAVKLYSCLEWHGKRGYMKELYGVMKDGKKVSKYIIENANGFRAEFLDMGAILDKLFVPDKDGNLVDVTLSNSSVEEYEADGNFFGATVGPNANRIAKAEVVIDGVLYKMPVNDGENNLHTDVVNGVHRRIWDAKEEGNSVIFTINLPDGEFGLPGNRMMQVTYTVTDDNAIRIDYYATSDKKTIYNMTNHTHFNLDGHASGSVLDHVLWLDASCFTPVVAGAIPTGEIKNIKGTIFDFTTPKTIGPDINTDDEQINLVSGYDHNYVIDDADGTLKEVAWVKGPKSGRVMKVISDQPGIQLYTDNFVKDAKGKDGVVYGWRQGLCLETQAYPDSIHQDSFPDVIYGPDREYRTTTIYKFE